MYEIEVKKRNLMLSEFLLLNMPEYTWMCLNKQDFECASGSKYVKILNMAILNMAGFSICECYTALWIC